MCREGMLLASFSPPTWMGFSVSSKISAVVSFFPTQVPPSRLPNLSAMAAQAVWMPQTWALLHFREAPRRPGQLLCLELHRQLGVELQLELSEVTCLCSWRLAFEFAFGVTTIFKLFSGLKN